MDLAYVALNRFGLGAEPGQALLPELKDPKNWLVEQIRHYASGQPDPNVYPMSHTPADFMAYCGEHFRRSPRSGQSIEVPDQAAGNIWNFGHNLKRQSEIARVARAIDTPHPFVERLMHFWSNSRRRCWYDRISRSHGQRAPAALGPARPPCSH